jgi:hypothetical protein
MSDQLHQNNTTKESGFSFIHPDCLGAMSSVLTKLHLFASTQQALEHLTPQYQNLEERLLGSVNGLTAPLQLAKYDCHDWQQPIKNNKPSNLGFIAVASKGKIYDDYSTPFYTGIENILDNSETRRKRNKACDPKLKRTLFTPQNLNLFKNPQEINSSLLISDNNPYLQMPPPFQVSLIDPKPHATNTAFDDMNWVLDGKGRAQLANPKPTTTQVDIGIGLSVQRRDATPKLRHDPINPEQFFYYDMVSRELGLPVPEPDTKSPYCRFVDIPRFAMPYNGILGCLAASLSNKRGSTHLFGSRGEATPNAYFKMTIS